MAYAILLIRTAWVCDDAYITFRTVWNFLHGYGLRWNVINRVQAFTHPLWMFVMAGASAITGEVYFTSMVLGIALSVATVVLVAARLASSTPMALLALSALAVSRSFVDYSTSGLEGPLAHLLIAACVLAASAPAGARSTFAAACAGALLWITRPDALALVAPLLLTAFLQRRRHAAALFAGALPLVAWTAFALVYYGFALPNTAPAKLGSGLPRTWLVVQGLHYLWNSLRLDPLTLFAIASALALALYRRERTSLLIAAGLLLELAYVVWIGGDFMSGRFLAAPLFAAALILGRSQDARGALPLAAFLAALALASPHSPLRAPPGAYLDGSLPHEHIDARGIADERAYWFHYTGLFSPARSDPERLHVTHGHPFGEGLRAAGPQVLVVDGMGFTGYFAGPVPHLLDPMGLTDPLLARLPIWRDGAFLAPQKPPEGMSIPWRIGHFRRAIPEGYELTLESGVNRIASPPLAECWDMLALITRAPLTAPGRWRAILGAHLGALDELIERYLAGEDR